MYTILKEKPQKPADESSDPKQQKIIWLSVSKTKTFLSCKSKFKKAYIEKLPKLEKDFLIFGKFMHLVLELFVRMVLKESNIAYHIAMGQCFKKAYEEYKAKITDEQFKRGKEILSNYLSKLKKSKESGTLPTWLSTEQEFYIDIDGKVLLNGAIDLIQIDPDGVLHVADYKSSKLKSKKYLEKDFFQLQTYAFVMCAANENLQKVRTSYVMFEDDLNPITKEWTRKEAMEMEKSFLQYAAQIKIEESFKTETSPLCEYCDYLENCPEGSAFVAAREFAANKAKPGQVLEW